MSTHDGDIRLLPPPPPPSLRTPTPGDLPIVAAVGGTGVVRDSTWAAERNRASRGNNNDGVQVGYFRLAGNTSPKKRRSIVVVVYSDGGRKKSGREEEGEWRGEKKRLGEVCD